MSSKASKQQANNILDRNADILEHIAGFVTLQDGSFRLVSKDFQSFSKFQPYIGRISPELTDVNTLLGRRTTIIIQSKYEDLNYVVKALNIVKAVRDLKDKSVLTNLDLSSNRVGVEGAKALAEALKVNRVLVSLNLASNYLTDDGKDMSGILALAAALGSSVLTDLNLANNNLASWKYVHESELPHNNYKSGDVVNYKGHEHTVLREKDYEGDVLLASNVGVKAIAKALENSVLTNLNLRNNYIMPDGAKALADALSTVNMTKLDVGYNDMNEEAALAIVRAVLRPGNIMTSLGLARCSIGPEGAKAIAEYVKDTKGRSVLKNLNVASNAGINGEAAQQLAAAALGSASLEVLSEVPIKELREDKHTSLDLSSKRLGPTEGIVLAELTKVSGVLTDLNLANNNLTSSNYVHESKLPHNNYKSGDVVNYEGQELTVLLQKDSHGDVLIGSNVGVKAIAEALKVNGVLTKIGEGGLDLRGNSIGEQGWTAIIGAVCSSTVSNISTIDASSKGIGPAGAKLISESLKTSVNSVLKGCDMRFNLLDAAAEQMLRDAVKGRESFDLLVV